VRLTANPDAYPLLDEYASELPGLFIVSQVQVAQASACDGLSSEISVKIERADGVKCERCWKHTTDTGADPQFPTICGACAVAVKEMVGA